MNEKITSGDLAELLAKRSKISQTAAIRFIRVAFPLISEVLQVEKYLKINGLGTFKLIVVNSRESVNVSTGERMLIPSYNKISFTPDAALRDLVNKPFAHFENVELKDDVDFGELDDEENDGFPGKDSLDLQQSALEVQDVVPEIDEEEKGIVADFIKETDEVPVSSEEALETEQSVEGFSEEETRPAVKEVDHLSEGASASLPVQSDSVQIKVDSVQIETASVEIHSAAVPSAVPLEATVYDKTKVSSSESDSVEMESEREKAIFSRGLSKVFCICTLMLFLLVGLIFYIGIEKPVWVVRYFAEDDEVPVSAKTVSPERSSVKSDQPVLPTVNVNAGSETDSSLLSTEKEERVWITTKHANYREYMVSSESLDTIEIVVGTSLIRLAEKYYGCQDLWPLIAEKNNAVLKDPDHLPIGKTLVIPRLKRK